MRTETLIPEQSLGLMDALRAGLCEGQKRVPYVFFYDEVGSALFEAITLLPEYGLTRAEARLLRRNANAIIDRSGYPAGVAELGSGTGKKTRWILQALTLRRPTTYFPIDISSSVLDHCERDLGILPGLSVNKLNQNYLDGLAEVAGLRSSGEKLLVLFLGSSIGNLEPFEADSMLLNIRGMLRKDDALLLGADLEKEVPRMLSAYDDAAGVTAAFNLNILAHLNRALSSDFDLQAFAHEVRYNQQEHRIEMHLRSLIEQSVVLPAAGLSIALAKNETIWTESSYKYRAEQLVQTARNAGFEPAEQWIDQDWPFALNLWIAR